jgi:hypothetical protein
MNMHHRAPAQPSAYERLQIVPVTLRAACAYVNEHHRHLRAPAGAKLAIAVQDQRGHLRGIALVGRPVARRLDDGMTLEVTRVATDGCPNACSALYAAARRAARALGYRKLVAYTRASEHGTSVRAAGWVAVHTSRGGGWSRATRPRRDHDPSAKVRWESLL